MLRWALLVLAGCAAADEQGYAVVGDDLFPPLERRVRAVACPDGGACVVDADCGDGMACYCREAWLPARCVPAECRTGADCAGDCLVSIEAGDCALRLVCARRASTCRDGGDCPGNGTACVYEEAADRFACSLEHCGD